MDLSLREEEPPTLTPKSTVVQRASLEKWEHSNRVCLMVMKYTMEMYIRQSILENDKDKDFMRSVGEKFKTFDKAQKGQYLSFHKKTKYDGVSGVREHMMKLVHFYNKLKSLKTSHNTQKKEWTIDEMIAIVSQDEASIKKTKSHSVQFIAFTSGTKRMKKGFKGMSRFEKGNTGKAPMHSSPRRSTSRGIVPIARNSGIR
ncbi:hypothetical protein SESBI_49799 [Sesbania bispinosa]|nr:hypothetical protein SESBI_49799 [Sesbania bispinosa]